MTVDVAFYAIAVGIVATGIYVVASRDLVRAALAMVANFILTAGLYVLLRAPFVAAAQLIVYAGAIMVLFLFVVMILGQRSVRLDEPLVGQRWLGLLGVVILGGVLAFAVSEGVPAAVGPDASGKAPEAVEAFGSPQAIAESLFSEHVFAFEVVSILLLVAIVGAVVLTRGSVRAEDVGRGDAGTDGPAGSGGTEGPTG